MVSRLRLRLLGAAGVLALVMALASATVVGAAGGIQTGDLCAKGVTPCGFPYGNGVPYGTYVGAPYGGFGPGYGAAYTYKDGRFCDGNDILFANGQYRCADGSPLYYSGTNQIAVPGIAYPGQFGGYAGSGFGGYGNYGGYYPPAVPATPCAFGVTYSSNGFPTCIKEA